MADPLLDSSYGPLTGSPCMGAGAFVGYFSDASGRPFKNPPTIGAYEDYTITEGEYIE